MKTKIRRGLLVLAECVRISHRKLLGGSKLEGLIARVSCLHETVLPAAHVGLLGISPCWEASKEKDDVEEATTAALSKPVLAGEGFAVLASFDQAGEGSLTLALLRMCPLLQVSRKKAVDEAFCDVSCFGGFCPFGVVGQGASDAFR